jgi:signal transduction histidine kinase
LESLEKAAVDNEISALKKIHDLLADDEEMDLRQAMAENRHRKLSDYFATTIELIKKKNTILGKHLVFLQKGLAHIMEIITLQQRYAGLRGFETRVNVNELIKDAEEMLADSIKKRGIRMEYELSNIPHMMLDKNKMVQNFINLIKNAYEAIDMAPDDIDKRIRVATGVVTIKDRNHLQVVISDTGVGLAKELKEKVFQFNFSTKGRQTGFGLHDAANYIKAHGGDIDLISPGPGKGTQVVIHIPVTGGSAE